MSEAAPAMATDEKTQAQPEVKVEVDESWSRSTPIDTPLKLDENKRRLHRKYGDLFKDEDEFELFCMLPVNDKERERLVDVMVANAKAVASVLNSQSEQ